MYKINILTRISNFCKRKIAGPIVKYIFLKLGFQERYRILNTNSGAIGHLCIDVDCFLKEKINKNLPFRGVLLAPRKRVANEALSDLWANSPGLVRVQNIVLCFLLDYLRTYKETAFDCSKYCAIDGQPAEVFAVNREYKNDDPIIVWEAGMQKRAKSLFKSVFPSVDEMRIAVLHSRDSTYDQVKQNANLHTQNYRNSDVSSFSEILNFLRQQKYSIIRIGEYEKADAGEDNQYLTISGVNKEDNDLLNIYVASICRVFLGSASGASNLAAIWNRPVFLTNILPYAFLRPHYRRSMAIPKLLSRNKKIFGIKEIFDKNYHWYREDRLYGESGLEIAMNSPSDCVEDFKEFFKGYVEGDEQVQRSLEESDQQQRYASLCPNDSYDRNAQSLIPRQFFNKYNLL